MNTMNTMLRLSMVVCLMLSMSILTSQEASAQKANVIDRFGTVLQDGQSVEPKDSIALVALYDATDGANWFDNSGWLTEMVEFWHGVDRIEEIEVEEGVFEWRVTRFNLRDNNLAGELPVEIGLLDRIEFFEVRDNQITGNIPREVENMLALQRLELGGNLPMTGRPPWEELVSLPDLRRLGIQDCFFTGEIPPVVGNFPRLERAQWHKNPFSGVLPAELGQVNTLQRIMIANTFMTGDFPQEWSNLENLGMIHIMFNPFMDAGPIPEYFQHMEELGQFRLLGTNRTGTVPMWLATKANLEDLWIGGYDQLEGPIPDLTFASGLRRLYIYETGIDGPIPGWLGALPNLEALQLRGLQVTGQIPQSLGNAQSLTRIALKDLPNVVGPFPDLRNLNLQWFRIQNLGFDIGPFPEWLNDMTSIRQIRMMNVGLEGQIPESWGSFNLQWLKLEGNPGVTGELPDWVTNNNNRLTEIRLGYTGIEIGETFPQWVCNMPQLQHLRLEGLGMSGPIPDCLGDLVALGTMGDQARAGWIPHPISLADNEFTGPIPASLGKLSNVTGIDLSNNQLSGEIPEEFFNIGIAGNTTLLQVLDISGNADLTGPIPMNITGYNPNWLRVLHYDGTDLCEPADAGFQDWLQAMHDAPDFPIVVMDIGGRSIRGTGVPCGTGTTAENYDGKPYHFALSQNYPNPFNPSTHISYEIPEESSVRLSVYNVIGQQVVTLVNETMSAGRHEVTFDATGFSSGTYIYRLEAGGRVQTQSMILIK